MVIKINSIELSDNILKLLSKTENHVRAFAPDALMDLIADEYEFTKDGYFINVVASCLEKLENDGFIAHKPQVVSGRGHGFVGVITQKESYHLTFEGDFFYSQGGYLGQLQEKSRAERRVRISQTLTWILAVGVTTPFLWYFLDILNKFYPRFIPISVLCIVFLAGGVTGGLLIYILPQIDNVLRKWKNK